MDAHRTVWLALMGLMGAVAGVLLGYALLATPTGKSLDWTRPAMLLSIIFFASTALLLGLAVRNVTVPFLRERVAQEVDHQIAKEQLPADTKDATVARAKPAVASVRKEDRVSRDEAVRLAAERATSETKDLVGVINRKLAEAGRELTPEELVKVRGAALDELVKRRIQAGTAGNAEIEDAARAGIERVTQTAAS